MNRFHQFLTLSTALLLVLALSPVVGNNLAAQVSKGSISGSILDPQGGAVPSAKVRVVNVETNAEVTGESDSSGLFRISLLPVGVYRVEISHAGFRKTVLSSVQVSVGVDRDLGAVKLELGEVTATVEVTAAPPLMQSTEAKVSTSIQASAIQSFPGVLENQGLDFLALTVPGVASNRDLGFSNTNGPGFTVNGIRGRNNDQQIDGQNNNDNSVAGPGLFLSNPEFVQEYQIITNNFGPEYGRNSGSVVNIITKSGNNTWHGAIFGTESNSVLNALSNTQIAFAGLKKPDRFNDEFSGAAISGPWLKDRVFFSGGFDNEIVSQKQTFTAGLTPTPTGLGQLAGCYPASNSVKALTAFGPFGVGAGNPTVSGTPSTRQLAAPPVPNGTDSSGNPICNVEVGSVQRTLGTGSHTYDWISKIDVQSAKDHIYGRYIYNKSTFFNTNIFGTAAAGYPANVPALSQAVTISWTRTWTARMTNEARVNYGRLNVEFGKNGFGTVPGMKDIATALARVTTGGGFLGFGPATNAPQGRIVNTYQLQDNWSYFIGRHGLKAGVNFTYQRSPNVFLPNLNGAFAFSNLTNFAKNTPSSIAVAQGDPSLDFREKDTFLYFGDDFKWSNALTLNLGVTWSYYGQPANLFHDRTVARESNAATALWNPSLPLSVRTFPEIPAAKNSWGPSAGFAYSPQWGGWMTGGAGKTVLRGGYRLTYDPAFYNIHLNVSTSAPQVFLQSITGSTAAANPLPAVPTGPNVRAQLASFLTPGVFDPRSFNQTSLTPDFVPQRTHGWSFGIQREIRPNAVVEARYVGNHATRLFQSINFNPRVTELVRDFPSLFPGITPCPSSQAVVSSAVGRVRCDLGRVRQRTNTGYSDYHGMQLEFRGANLWHQLTVRTSYTWSKTTDNVSEIFGTFGAGNAIAFSQNPLDFKKAEHGLSGLNFSHDWKVTFTEEIPAFRSQQGAIGKILGGWVVSGNYFITSGQPYTPTQFILSFLSGAPYNDVSFNNAFVGTFETARPFLSNPGAPLTSVGIFGGDACSIFGAACLEDGSPDPAKLTTLFNFSELNTTGVEKVVTKNDVRFIVNGLVADQQFGTPFGTAGRNILRDFWTNIANFTLFKVTKFGEGRVQVRWHMSMLNVFNHPNFSSVDPFLDDAGLATEANGFGIPQLTSGGIQTATGAPGRSIRFGVRVGF
ncbi:MAG: TonB-dependent receptor [Acidobacteria bacterium]|nr:TonB-dependent receptor [Acidobacteriota bacterium]